MPQKIRTRFAPSPTGFMQLGNLRTALYEYLIAKHGGGTFILRIEDTDQKRFVPGATDVILDTLRLAGLGHDEGPDVGGAYGPYVQSERRNNYLGYAEELVAKGAAYYCFCEKDGHGGKDDAPGGDMADEADEEPQFAKYDRRCLALSKEQVGENLLNGMPYVIRQLIPDGDVTFTDAVFGDITISTDELDDQVLIKSDGMPTYNFANVVDDHLMEITHVARGNEYLSSTPKYKLLYEAFGWNVPTYVHLPQLFDESGKRLSKRRGAESVMALFARGFLPEAIVNYCALLGWSPGGTREIFTLEELVSEFEISGISKSPSRFDPAKLTWMNGEHFKRMDAEKFFGMAEPFLESAIKRRGLGFGMRELVAMVQPRISFLNEIPEMLDFIDSLPDYDAAIYEHKKMKTDRQVALAALEGVLPKLMAFDAWGDNARVYDFLVAHAESAGLKNGQLLWPVRTALSGKPATPCGASELCVLLGREESLRRIEEGIKKCGRRA